MSFPKEYTKLCELGKGGFAKVYKVRHNELGYIRVIKELLEPIGDKNSKTYNSFIRECKNLLRLGNGCYPNIVHIHKYWEYEGRAYMEMDFVKGLSLSQYLKKNGNFIPVDEVIHMVEEISGALAYCHEDIYKFCIDPDDDQVETDPVDGSRWLIDSSKRKQLIEKYKVIHNDIHSSNVMRREDGKYFLLDFGLAVSGNEDVRNSSRHEHGVPEFMAPEKFDNNKILTEYSDIYSFGVVMYEFLAGRVPFLRKGTTFSDMKNLYDEVKLHNIPSISGFRQFFYESSHPGQAYTKDYPDWLEAVILKCLEKDPEKRFKNGKELNDYVKKNICNNRKDQRDQQINDTTNQDVVSFNNDADAFLSKYKIDGDFDLSNYTDNELKEVFDKLSYYAYNGHVESMYNLAYMYEYGIGVEKSWDDAFKWYLKAAKLDYEPAMHSVALAYSSGQDEFCKQPRNFHKAEKWLQLLVDKGNVAALHDLGKLYQYGCSIDDDKTDFGETEDNFPMDIEKAFMLFSKAADKGCAPAMKSIGDLYMRGDIDGGLDKAVEWYEKAIKLGDFYAANELGTVYLWGNCWGENVSIDYTKALYYFNKALELTKDENNINDVTKLIEEALYCLLNKYKYSNKIEDLEEAVNLCEDALDEGVDKLNNNDPYPYNHSINILETLGYFYEQIAFKYMDGEDVKQDYKQALKWFQKAAEKTDNILAKYMLGEIYYNGFGVEKNINEAKKWYRLAADQGHEESRKCLETLK